MPLEERQLNAALAAWAEAVHTTMADDRTAAAVVVGTEQYQIAGASWRQERAAAALGEQEAVETVAQAAALHCPSQNASALMALFAAESAAY